MYFLDQKETSFDPSWTIIERRRCCGEVFSPLTTASKYIVVGHLLRVHV